MKPNASSARLDIMKIAVTKNMLRINFIPVAPGCNLLHKRIDLRLIRHQNFIVPRDPLLPESVDPVIKDLVIPPMLVPSRTAFGV